MVTNVIANNINVLSTESQCMKAPIFFKGTRVVLNNDDCATGTVLMWPVAQDEGKILIQFDNDIISTYNTNQVTRIY